MADFGEGLHDLESALDEMVKPSVNGWLEGVSIELGEEGEPDLPIDPDAKRAISDRLIAASAALVLLERACDPGDEWESALRQRAYDLRRRACLDLFVLTAGSAGPD